jgi:hypothetical protein
MAPSSSARSSLLFCREVRIEVQWDPAKVVSAQYFVARATTSGPVRSVGRRAKPVQARIRTSPAAVSTWLGVRPCPCQTIACPEELPPRERRETW